MSLLFSPIGGIAGIIIMFVYVVLFVLLCRLLIAITRYFNRKS